MGIPKLWEILADAGVTRSLLNLATIEGLRNNSFLVIGVDINIRIHAILAALNASGVSHPTPALLLEKLFYQLCNFALAPVIFVFIFDGPGRPSIKRGIRVGSYQPAQFIPYLKAMILSFGFYFYDAKAEAELAQLNEHGKIDGIITEDSDAFIFGARCVIRTSGPSVQDTSLTYTLDAIENTEKVSLDRDGLLLCALLLGGDYGPGLAGAGPKVARALAAHGFGRTLVKVVETFRGSDLHLQLDRWRNTLRHELRENSAGLLTKRYPKLADDISDAFPSLPILRLYLDPLTSRSPRFMGPQPDVVGWRPREPNIPAISAFCSSRFGWNGVHLLKKLNSNLWPCVVFRLISAVKLFHPFIVSVLTNTQHDVSYNPKLKLFTSSSTKATLQKATKLTKYNTSFIDSGALDIYRVRLSTSYFVALAGLDAIVAEEKIKLVSIPRVILSSAMRESSSVSTDIWTLGSDEEDFAANKSANDASDCCKEDSNAGHGGQRDEDNVIELTDDDEKDFTDVHAKLAAQGIIDLTGELD
ncbi:PIN domain-like protein [Mycena galopus ATCC 62051]|nr:PIN domain-like protein [Mycena galopus ATCC 62051]